MKWIHAVLKGLFMILKGLFLVPYALWKIVRFVWDVLVLAWEFLPAFFSGVFSLAMLALVAVFVCGVFGGGCIGGAAAAFLLLFTWSIRLS